jgi:hypothetical protein
VGFATFHEVFAHPLPAPFLDVLKNSFHFSRRKLTRVIGKIPVE